MKKKELFQSLKVIALALVLAVGVSYATGAWEDASGTPPENNAPRPVNVSEEVQTKAGDLYIESPTGNAILAGDTLSVWGVSNFSGQVSLGMEGGVDEDVPIYVSGQATFDNLSLDNNPDGIAYPAQVCVDSEGSLILCASPLSVSVNTAYAFSGTQEPGDECPGDIQSYTFSAGIAGGVSPFTYQWQRSYDGGAYVNVGTSSTYAMTMTAGDSNSPDVGEPHSYNIKVTVTDNAGLVMPSSPHTITQLMFDPTADFDNDGSVCPV